MAADELDRTRRRFLRALGRLGAASAGLWLMLTPRRGPTQPTIRVPEPAPGDRETFMRHALEMRRRALERGDQPFGAVVVRDGRVVGEGVSAVVVERDPTAHAEMEAIRDAARRLDTADLAGCELYATSPPCRMCETAAYWARITRMYVGSGLADAGAPGAGRC